MVARESRLSWEECMVASSRPGGWSRMVRTGNLQDFKPQSLPGVTNSDVHSKATFSKPSQTVPPTRGQVVKHLSHSGHILIQTTITRCRCHCLIGRVRLHTAEVEI